LHLQFFLSSPQGICFSQKVALSESQARSAGLLTGCSAGVLTRRSTSYVETLSSPRPVQNDPNPMNPLTKKCAKLIARHLSQFASLFLDRKNSARRLQSAGISFALKEDPNAGNPNDRHRSVSPSPPAGRARRRPGRGAAARAHPSTPPRPTSPPPSSAAAPPTTRPTPPQAAPKPPAPAPPPKPPSKGTCPGSPIVTPSAPSWRALPRAWSSASSGATTEHGSSLPPVPPSTPCPRCLARKAPRVAPDAPEISARILTRKIICFAKFLPQVGLTENRHIR